MCLQYPVSHGPPWDGCVLASLFFVLLIVTPLRAQDAPLPPVSIGAGARTSFVHTDPQAGDSTDAFLLDSVRLYVSGSVTKTDQVHVQHRVRREQPH